MSWSSGTMRKMKMSSDFCSVGDTRCEAIHATTLLRYYATYVDCYLRSIENIRVVRNG